MFGQVVVQVRARVADGGAPERGLAHLARAAEVHHLARKVAFDLRQQVAGKLGGYGRAMNRAAVGRGSTRAILRWVEITREYFP